MYSPACKITNRKPRNTVANNHQHNPARWFFFSAQWANVTVAPLESRMMVLIAGMPNAGMTSLISVNLLLRPSTVISGVVINGQTLSNDGQRNSLVAAPAPSPPNQGTE